MAPSDPARPLHVPPADDEPLDAVELAIVRALVPIFAERIRKELAQEQRSPKANDQSGDTQVPSAGN